MKNLPRGSVKRITMREEQLGFIRKFPICFFDDNGNMVQWCDLSIEEKHSISNVFQNTYEMMISSINEENKKDGE